MHDPSSLSHMFSALLVQLKGRYITQQQRMLTLLGATKKQMKKGLKPQWDGKKTSLLFNLTKHGGRPIIYIPIYGI